MLYAKRTMAALLAASIAFAPLAGCAAASNNGGAQQQSQEQKQTTTDYMVLVNKQNKLPDDWEENLDLVEEESLLYDDPVQTERGAYEAYQGLKEDLAKEGVYVELDSCYRSTAEQQEIIDEFTKKYGEDYVKQYVSQPGYSEHHTGLAIDLFLVIDGKKVYENEEMVQHPEIWEKVHAKLADHGFILRLLEGKEDITGYSYEPWHIRYVGDPKIAHEIMDKGITLEEYLGVADEARAANAAAEAEAAAAEAAKASEAEYEVDYGTSQTYTHKDIDAAIETVMAEFGTWDGCTMKKIAYSDDETSRDDLEYCNSLREEGTEEYDQAMVLVSSFHSPSAEKAEGTAWEPDTDYDGYTWHLARTTNGEWNLLTWGYE